MRRKFGICLVALAGVLPWMGSSASAESAKSYEQATVISVNRQEVSGPGLCCSTPTDAPLQTQYYAYEVAIRVNCETYVGHYETPFDFLSSAFAPEKPIAVRLTKHLMYFDVDGREMKMGIVRHTNNQQCNGNRASR